MNLFFRKYGQGKPVIILHGIFGCSDNWVSIAKTFSGINEVFIPDQRNHGNSPHSDHFNYMVMTEDLVEFIDNHHIENPVIIGHSMGGKVAMNFSLQHPDIPRGLVVIDMSLRQYPPRQIHQDIVDFMLSVDFNHIQSRADVENLLAQKIKEPRIRNYILKNLQRVHRDRFRWKPNVKAIYWNLEEMFESIDETASYNGPALFIRGGKSDYIPEADFPYLESKFTSAIFHTIEHATHWVHVDAPDEVSLEIRNFLQSLRQA